MEYITKAMMDDHPQYKLVYDRNDSYFRYKIYEYIQMLDSDNKPGVYSKVVNVFQNQEDAIKHFLYLTNENHYTIMSYGRIS